MAGGWVSVKTPAYPALTTKVLFADSSSSKESSTMLVSGLIAAADWLARRIFAQTCVRSMIKPFLFWTSRRKIPSMKLS